MFRRRLLLLTALLFLPLIGIGVYVLIPPKPGVTLENFRRLYRGMTPEKVEAILGPATRSYHCSHGEECFHVDWYTDNTSIQMTFTDAEQVAMHGYFRDETTHHAEGLVIPAESVPDMVRRCISDLTGW